MQRRTGKRHILPGWGALTLSVILITGCSSKEANKLRQEGIDQLNAGDYPSAIQSFDAALEARKGKAGQLETDVLKYRAEAEYCLEDYAAAAHTYEILSQIDETGLPEYLYLKASAQAKDGKQEVAEETFFQANEKAESVKREVLGKDQAFSSIGDAYERSEEFSEAEKFYEKAEQSGYLSAELYNRLGLCCMKRKAEGDYEKALQYFEKGIALGDQRLLPQLKYNEAVAYEYLGNFSKALELLEHYEQTYGADDSTSREIVFLKSRQESSSDVQDQPDIE